MATNNVAPENEHVLNQLIKSFERRDFKAMDDLFAKNVVVCDISCPSKSNGNQAAIEMLSSVTDAFPEMALEISEKAVQDSIGFFHGTWHGKHTCKIGHLEPTNKPLSQDFMCSVQITDAKIGKITMIADRYGFLRELGVELPDLAFIKNDSGDTNALAASLNGEVITPLSPNYAKIAQLANGDVVSKPAVMILCHGVSDIIKAIAFCKDWEKRHPEAPQTVVRGGGHSFWGASTNVGGCVIDLRKMRSVVVDPIEQTAWVDGGATVRELDREAFVHGLVIPTGQISHTGIGGLATGGGYGLLTYKLGLMIDSVLAYELVLHDGRVVQCSATENPELFWACKGGARWLGVVSRFKFQLHKLTAPTCNTIVAWDAALSQKCFKAYRKMIDSGQDAFAFAAIASPLNMGGATIFLMHVVVHGDIGRANKILDGLNADIGTAPIAKLLPLAERPWPEINSSVEFLNSYGSPLYIRGFEIDSTDEEKQLSLINTFLNTRTPNVALIFDFYGGEFCKRSQDGFFDAKGPRRSVLSGVLMAELNPGDVEGKMKDKDFLAKILKQEGLTSRCTYINFDESSLLAERTSHELRQRFEKVKCHFDPEGFFGKNF